MNNDWTFELIEYYFKEIEEISKELNLDYYPLQIEIINSEQMLDRYSNIGMPIFYNHWSYGKSFIQNKHLYDNGKMGLAYEIILNLNPSICYLMENNSMTMQILVLAHCIGHSGFFCNNYMFKDWTDADSILDYLNFAKKYVKKCEETYGVEAVEETLDACHSIMTYGVDRYKRKPFNLSKEELKQQEREKYLEKQVNDLWRTVPNKKKKNEDKKPLFPKEPEENILYFIEKNSPSLKIWQREIVRIVRKISQYFYPQTLTNLCNEGFACFVHYYIMNRLYEKNIINEGHYLEFIHNHSNVVFQLPYDDKRYNGINPYALGFEIFMDIKRISENPTEEDKEWFPDLINKPWLDNILNAMKNYRNDSFILQFLSPRLMRKWKMFVWSDKYSEPNYLIKKIQNEQGYKEIRSTLSKQYSNMYQIPDIQVYDVDLKGDRTLYLRHYEINGIPLNGTLAHETLKYIKKLWGYKVVLISWDSDKNTFTNKWEIL